MSRSIKDSRPWRQFRTANPNEKSVLLDVGRAEVLLNMVDTPQLVATDARLYGFIGATFGASDGDPAVLRIFIEALSNWPQLDHDVLSRKIERFWRSFQERAPDFDCTAMSRRICTEQTPPLPASMIEAIFDDPSFDFVAYLDWHNS